MHMPAAAPTLSIKLEPEVRDRLSALAEHKKRSSHALMREAIGEYVSREEARRDFDAEALRSWEHYQETGQHTTLAEVDTWLASIGTDKELPAPTCRK